MKRLAEAVMEQRVAAKAIIADGDGRVLLLREAATNPDDTNAGRYHLPGGRVRPGERLLTALRREIHEETGLRITVGQVVFAGDWWPIIHGQAHHIVGIFYACRATAGAVSLSHEHDIYEWVDPRHLGQYDVMAPEPEAVVAWLKYHAYGH